MEKIKHIQKEHEKGCALYALANLFGDDSFLIPEELDKRHIITSIHEALPPDHGFRQECRVICVARCMMPFLPYSDIMRAVIKLTESTTNPIPVLIETQKAGYHVTPAIIEKYGIFWQPPLEGRYKELKAVDLERFRICGIYAIFNKDGQKVLTYD